MPMTKNTPYFKLIIDKVLDGECYWRTSLVLVGTSTAERVAVGRAMRSRDGAFKELLRALPDAQLFALTLTGIRLLEEHEYESAEVAPADFPR